MYLGIRLKEKKKDGEEDLRPLVKLVGNMHGNEPTGREILIHLAKYIVQARSYYVKNSDRRGIKNTWVERASKIMENTDLWLLPTMNPDG